MAQLILNNLIRILFLLLLQALVVSRMDWMHGMILPWIYIFGILMLPFETPRWVVLVVAGSVGLGMDYFMQNPGLHTSACLFVGYLQPLIQKIISPREGYEATQRPTVQRMGLPWYLTYAGVLALAHHCWLFYLEVFRFTDFFQTFLRVLLSTIATLLLMTIGQYLIYSAKKSER
ncbi:MAG: hypothetical protein SH856_10800 [Flavobacteriales bacterium]|nr:hypothetical protein [Flavobacteriales bacterium]